MARLVLDIFLSSTIEDLGPHRAAVTHALARLGQVGIRSEDWNARSSPALPTCREEVQRCDALVVVVGHRYGWVPPKGDDADGLKSITWLEVEWALAADKPVYAFLVDQAAPWPGESEQDALLSARTEADGIKVWRRVRSLQEFRDFLDQRMTRALFATPDQLASLVQGSLFQLVLDHKVTQATRQVEQAPLTAPPPTPPPAAASVVAPAAFHLEAGKEQAVVVGNDVILLAKELTEAQRSDVVNALSLAQLAKKSVAVPKNLDDVMRWYDEYVDVLSNIGFAFPDSGFERVKAGPGGVDFRQVLLDVAAVTLDPAALGLVGRTLASLSSLPQDDPKVSLFAVRVSQRAAHLQVVLVESDGADGLRLRTLTFGLETTDAVTEVLFFKSAKKVSALVTRADTVTVNTTVLSAVREAIAAKLAARGDTAVAGLDLD